jgi:pentatricopeptide repeat protein
LYIVILPFTSIESVSENKMKKSFSLFSEMQENGLELWNKMGKDKVPLYFKD